MHLPGRGTAAQSQNPERPVRRTSSLPAHGVRHGACLHTMSIVHCSRCKSSVAHSCIPPLGMDATVMYRAIQKEWKNTDINFHKSLVFSAVFGPELAANFSSRPYNCNHPRSSKKAGALVDCPRPTTASPPLSKDTHCVF